MAESLIDRFSGDLFEKFEEVLDEARFRKSLLEMLSTEFAEINRKLDNLVLQRLEAVLNASDAAKFLNLNYSHFSNNVGPRIHGRFYDHGWKYPLSELSKYQTRHPKYSKTVIEAK